MQEFNDLKSQSVSASEQHGTPNAEVARRLGVSASYVAAVEAGRHNLDEADW
jgi:transcriptional regulator with XRE-family HTH domain